MWPFKKQKRKTGVGYNNPKDARTPHIPPMPPVDGWDVQKKKLELELMKTRIDYFKMKIKHGEQS